MSAVGISEAQSDYDSVERRERDFNDRLKSKRLRFFQENRRFAEYYSRSFQRVVQANIPWTSLDRALSITSKLRLEMCENAINWFDSALAELQVEYADRKDFKPALINWQKKIKAYKKNLRNFRDAYLSYVSRLESQRNTGFSFNSIKKIRCVLIEAEGSASQIYLDWFSGTVVGAGVVLRDDDEAMEAVNER